VQKSILSNSFPDFNQTVTAERVSDPDWIHEMSCFCNETEANRALDALNCNDSLDTSSKIITEIFVQLPYNLTTLKTSLGE